MAIHTFYRTASFAVFMLFLKMGRSDIVVAPNNSEAKIGGSTYFNCSTSVTSEEIHWFHYPIGNQDRSFVFGFGQFYTRYIGRFAMENNATTGEYNLVITSVVAEDAGKYECQDEAGRGKKQSAQLIVLATELVCQSNVDVDKVIGPNACGIKLDQLILSCVAQFRGNEAPILQWRLNDSKTITNDVTHRINGSSVVYSLAIRNDQISNGSVYVCETTRSTTKISCESGKVKVVGSTETPGASDGDSSCAGQTNAVICLVVLFILSLAIIVILIILILKPELKGNIRNRFLRSTKSTKQSKDKENQQTIEEESKKAETSVTNQNPEEGTDVQAPLIANQPEESIEDLKAQIKKLENDAKTLQQRIDKRDQIIKKNQQNHDSNQSQSDNDKLEERVKEFEKLQPRVKYLEQHLYPKENIDYIDKPVFAHTLHLSEVNKRKPINGIAILDNEFFVVTESSQEMEVYDSKTFQHQGIRRVKGLALPLDIASSEVDKCLYIIDRVNADTDSNILKIDSTANVLNIWTTGGGYGRLSTYESNVIVCLYDKQLVTEFSQNGDWILTVPLSPAAKLNHPLHAIKVTSAHFVVSHGDDKDDLHRVCVVDLDGNIKKECTKFEKSLFKSHEKIKVPICLAEDSERSIVVADRDNSRILLLSSQLKYQRKLVEEEHGLKGCPVRLCFDRTQSKLFVAVNKWSKKEWKDGSIIVYNIK